MKPITVTVTLHKQAVQPEAMRWNPSQRPSTPVQNPKYIYIYLTWTSFDKKAGSQHQFLFTSKNPINLQAIEVMGKGQG